MKGQVAAGCEFVKFLLKGIPDSLDSLEVVLFCPCYDITIKGPYDLSTIAVGSDLEWVFSL